MIIRSPKLVNGGSPMAIRKVFGFATGHFYLYCHIGEDLAQALALAPAPAATLAPALAPAPAPAVALAFAVVRAFALALALTLPECH